MLLDTGHAGVDVDETAIDAFLDRELGTACDHCQVIRLLRFSDDAPPRIVHNQPLGGRA